MVNVTGSKWMKYALMGLHVIALIFGLIMLIAGSVTQSRIDNQQMARTVGGYSTQAGSIICIIFGLVVIVMSFFGMWATMKNNRRALIFYIVVMCIVFVIQFITGVTGLSTMHSTKFHNTVEDMFKAQFNVNTTNSTLESDFYQEKLHCCGWASWKDWEDLSKEDLGVPKTCFMDESKYKNSTNADTIAANVWQTGCHEKLISAVETIIEVACGVLVAFSLFNFVGIVMAAMWAKKLHAGNF